MPQAVATSPPVWRSPAALAERLNQGASRPTFTINSIRHLVRESPRNGLGPAVRRIGRKVLIDEVAFRAWLETR